MFDCIIVGSGPAGGTAAYHLAKRGRSVLVVEKQSLPRYKACSGGVSPAIAQWFDFDFSPAISLKVNKARLTWKMADPVEVDLGPSEPMWMVRRDIFDQFLIQQAQKQGAEIRENTEVTGIEFKSDRWQVNTSTEPLVGRYIIAADGARGQMAKLLGLKEAKRRMAAAMEIETTAPPAEPILQFEFGTLKNGYIWTFPKANGYSLGIGSFVGGEQKDLKNLLTEYATKLGLNVANSQQYEHPMCLWDGNQKLHAQNAVLAGETAGILDPFTAEGLRPSIFSGMKAAEAIDKALAGTSDALEQYTQIISEEWGVDMEWAKKISAIFYRIPGIAYKMGVNLPGATERMVQILCGEIRYSDVADRAIKRLSSKLIPGMGG